MAKNPSFASHATRLLAAASLACTVATVGCTTDRTPGAGQPLRYGPSVGPTMPSSTPGSEQGRPVNPPMISSYTPAPNAVMPRHVDFDAVAIAAANQGFRGRYLGPADPGGVATYVANPQTANFQTGQFVNPSDYANPQITVNSSISSQPTPVITSGGGGTIVSGFAVTPATTAGTTGAITSSITTTPTTAATTLTPTAAANSVTNATTRSSAAAAPAAVINNLGGLLTPTMSSAATISPTAAANIGVGNVGAGRTVATTTTTTTNRTSALSTATGSSSAFVIGRSANGTITISNVSSGTDRAVSTTQPVTTPQTPGLRLH